MVLVWLLFKNKVACARLTALKIFQKSDLAVCGTCANYDRMMRTVVDRSLVPHLDESYGMHIGGAK